MEMENNSAYLAWIAWLKGVEFAFGIEIIRYRLPIS